MLKTLMGGLLFTTPAPKDISISFGSFAKPLAQQTYRLMMPLQVSVELTERAKAVGRL